MIASVMVLGACDPCVFYCTEVFVTGQSSTVDVDAYRVTIGEVGSLDDYPIPETRSVAFTWSPQGVARQHRAGGYPPATTADWIRESQRIFDTGPAEIAPAVEREREEFREEGYQAVVFPDGTVGHCAEAYLGRRQDWCSAPPDLPVSDQVSLTRTALATAEPECRIDEVNPEVVVDLLSEGQWKPDGRHLWVTVDCR